MNKTPRSSRLHVGIFGETNSGKSSLFNSIIGQDLAIVSEQKGTTTDPVTKSMELTPFGPIVLIDTAGLGDYTNIGEDRVKKTREAIDKVDFAIYVADINDFNWGTYEDIIDIFKRNKIDHILVFTKTDIANSKTRNRMEKLYKNARFTSVYDLESITHLKMEIANRLENLKDSETLMIGDLLDKSSTVIMVVPLDEAAPKGRLILPQVQFIRECLDYEINCLVTRESQLDEIINKLDKIDLIVTDSKIFPMVDSIVGGRIPLTSFSILLARQKGDLHKFVQGARAIENLTNNGRVLMAEACTHNHTHEDIGRVKIPSIIRKYTGKKLDFDFYSGYDFPNNLNEYDLVIFCGSCMINKRLLHTRLLRCEEAGVAISNYGVVLAYVNDILPRAIEIFEQGSGRTYD